MSTNAHTAQSLRRQVAEKETELCHLKARLLALESRDTEHDHVDYGIAGSTHPRWPLTAEEYKRYGRQIIMPEIGPQGQSTLKHAKVLIVGAGGLGCPAAAYLAGAGVGTLGLVDGDQVEISNLHRQIAHSTVRVGQAKVESAIEYCKGLNPNVTFVAHSKFLSSEDALRVFEPYDIVLDCTDHPTSRYLISDTCVLLGKPLVSASALKTEGQLMVLNNPPAEQGSSSGGPCYRCVFPKPPPADSVVSCGEGGILGPVVGAMGILQALEAIKVICAPKPSRVASGEPPPSPTLLMFSAYSNPQFRSVRLRGRRSDCTACGTTPAITTESLTSGSLDYMAFCGVTNPVNILQEDERMTGPDLASKIKAPNSRMQQETDPPATIIDVRDPTHVPSTSSLHALKPPLRSNSRTMSAAAAAAPFRSSCSPTLASSASRAPESPLSARSGPVVPRPASATILAAT